LQHETGVRFEAAFPDDFEGDFSQIICILSEKLARIKLILSEQTSLSKKHLLKTCALQKAREKHVQILKRKALEECEARIAPDNEKVDKQTVRRRATRWRRKGIVAEHRTVRGCFEL
jgi:hypothetical protein